MGDRSAPPARPHLGVHRVDNCSRSARSRLTSSPWPTRSGALRDSFHEARVRCGMSAPRNPRCTPVRSARVAPRRRPRPSHISDLRPRTSVRWRPGTREGGVPRQHSPGLNSHLSTGGHRSLPVARLEPCVLAADVGSWIGDSAEVAGPQRSHLIVVVEEFDRAYAQPSFEIVT